MKDQFIFRDIKLMSNEFFLWLILCVSRKYPDPTMERIENSEGVGSSKAFQWGEGIEDKNSLPEGHVQWLFLRDFGRFFWCFRWSCCVFPTYLSTSCKRLYIYFIKVVSKQTSLNKRWRLWLFVRINLVYRIWILCNS